MVPIENEISTLSCREETNEKQAAGGKTIDEIELAILAMSQVESNKLECVGKKVDSAFKDPIIIKPDIGKNCKHDSEEENNTTRVALQQLESINSSSKRRKKTELSSVLCSKKLQPSTLDNNELIAILQGTDTLTVGNDKITTASENDNHSIKEEVLIEGEGHFSVIDIEEAEDNVKQKEDESIDSTVPLKNRKRKQDFKSDLVSTLASEWSDDEDSDFNNIQSSLEVAESSDIKIPEITPFKRTRVIKRKIIWDPDAPETQFSYASLIQPKNKTSPNQIKEINKKHVTSPLRRKVASNSFVDKTLDTIDKKQKVVVSITKKKKLTEIDRLLGDEGAANMLNSLEQQAEHLMIFENKTVSSLITLVSICFSIFEEI